MAAASNHINKVDIIKKYYTRHRKVLIEFYRSSGWAGRKLYIFFRFSAHPVDKNRGLVDPHGGHQFFQSARAVRERNSPIDIYY